MEKLTSEVEKMNVTESQTSTSPPSTTVSTSSSSTIKTSTATLTSTSAATETTSSGAVPKDPQRATSRQIEVEWIRPADFNLEKSLFWVSV